MHVTPWFLFRRLLYAALIVYGRFVTIWFTIAGNTILVLGDICYKIQYNRYQTYIGGLLEIYNDLYVLLGSYSLFYYTDFVPNPELKEQFGWIFIVAISIMVATNILVLSVKAGIDMTQWCKIYQAKRREKQQKRDKARRAYYKSPEKIALEKAN